MDSPLRKKEGKDNMGSIEFVPIKVLALQRAFFLLIFFHTTFLVVDSYLNLLYSSIQTEQTVKI